MNADLIAAGISPFLPEEVAFAAGRLMLARIRDLVGHGKSFAFETTLATRLYLRFIPKWQRAGYRVKLYFLKLPNPDFAIRRVELRVRLGGHRIPEPTIRRRFVRGWANLRNHYQGVVDEGSIYDASHAPALLIETGDNRPPQKLMEDASTYRMSGEPEDRVTPLDDPDFIGADAALRRAAAKAIERAKAAGLVPVIEGQADPTIHPS